MKKKLKRAPKSRAADNTSSAPAHPSRRRLAVLRLLMALGAVVVTLVLCEIGLRVLNVKPERYPRPRWQVWSQGAFRESNIWGNGLIKQPSRFEQSGLVMGEYVPGAMFRCVYASNPRGYFDPDSGVTMSVDSWGMRKRETDCAKEKSRSICRVLLLGDSFTFGVGVRDSDTFARRMEERINAVPVPSPRCEVLNAGVQGYNTRDEVLCLEGQWLTFSPDVVLIVFYINDAYDDATILNNGEALGIYTEQPPGMARESRLWDIAQHNIRVRRASKAVEEFYRKPFFSSAESFLEDPGDIRVDWTDGKSALARAAMLSKERSFSLGLVIFPELYRLDDGHPFQDVHRVVKKQCEDLGIPVLDLFETTFKGRNPRELWVHPSDHHPNEIAHRLAGDSIADFVSKRILHPQPGVKTTNGD